MSINFNNLQNSQQVSNDKTEQRTQVRQQTTQQATQQAAVQQPTTGRQDSVSLTPQAQQLKSLQQKASNASGVDQNKVNDIKKAISEGKYEVNVQRLAEKMAAFESDLFN